MAVLHVFCDLERDAAGLGVQKFEIIEQPPKL